MKVILLTTLILTTVFALGADEVQPDSNFVEFEILTPEVQHKKATQYIVHLLTKSHYQKKNLNDSLSSETFDRYLDKLDGNHFYFLKSDIETFEKHRYLFDDYFLAGHLQPAFEIFNIYQDRFAKRLEKIYAILQQGFDFSIDEYYDIGRDDAEWAESLQELDDIWRKRLKNDALNRKLSGEEWPQIQKTLTKRFKRIQRNVAQFQSEDVYQILMNSFSESFDPHTNYFSPKNFDNFRIRMSQAFEGIGARLTTRNDYTIVAEIIPGGPADKGQNLFPNDRITGVAQGWDGELVDVVGWRIDDVVQLIRGKKSTTVRLQVWRADAPNGTPYDTVAIVRDKIKLEEQSARSKKLEIEHEGGSFTFGVIEIPVFYADLEAMRKGETNFKSTTNDVRRLLTELQQENVDGIIVDLRQNGGGHLSEAINLSGLFIDNGPIVQVRNTVGRVDVEWDNDPQIVYEGPLAVIVDRLSASASEIFAAAIQDYNRGIIVGSQTFGKGTVQNMIDLNRFIRSGDSKLGQIKLTIAKFYRIDGGSTQHVGILPDITFPSRFNLMDIGESKSENALLWDKIEAVDFKNLGNVTEILPQLEVRHNLRISSDEQYAQLIQDLETFEKNKNTESISLNEQVRREERDKKRADKGTDADGSEEDGDKSEEENEDLMLIESGHVLGDYITLSHKK